MTGCRCCVFLTIFTLSVVFGKSFPKHVSLVKARFGDTLGYGAAGNRSRVQRRGFRLTVFLDLTCPVPRLRRADLLAVDPIRATGDSLAGHLCGLVSTRPLSSVSGFVLTSGHTARVSLEIVTSLSQALRTFELAPRAPRS
ncbi:unnamed protein product, partial [Effrenium voratum]